MEMEMQRLNAGMMERYEIEAHRPTRVNALQFGMGEAMLGAVNRLIDDYNAACPEDDRIGFTAVQAGEAGYAKRLSEQDGLYTLLIRGYAREEAVNREQVVQCVLRAIDPAEDENALAALARDESLEFIAVDDSPAARELAARFIALRRAAGLDALPLFHLGEAPEDWVSAFPMLADSLAFRAEPDEAARQCAEMNYLDEMLYIAEPYARLSLQASEGFQQLFPLDRNAASSEHGIDENATDLAAVGAAFRRPPVPMPGGVQNGRRNAAPTGDAGFMRKVDSVALSRVPGLRFADSSDMIALHRLKAHVFDAGLFLMAAPGWLNGCDTLSDCMKHERLRRFVGEGFVQEIIPSLSDMDAEAVRRCVIESFERYENPLNRNRILRAADHLIDRFSRGAYLTLRNLAEANFEPPRRLAFALAATIMLYAGARPNPDTGLWEVARGKQAEAIHDDPALLPRFATLSHDMDPESLAYAALADRELWGGIDLREIDGLMARVALDIAAMQRQPGWMPETE